MVLPGLSGVSIGFARFTTTVFYNTTNLSTETHNLEEKYIIAKSTRYVLHDVRIKSLQNDYSLTMYSHDNEYHV